MADAASAGRGKAAVTPPSACASRTRQTQRASRGLLLYAPAGYSRGGTHRWPDASSRRSPGAVPALPAFPCPEVNVHGPGVSA